MDAKNAKNIQHQILQSYTNSILPLVVDGTIQIGNIYELDVKHKLIRKVTICFKSRERSILKVFTKKNRPPLRVGSDNNHNFFHVNTNNPKYTITKIDVPKEQNRNIMTTGSGACMYYPPEGEEMWELIKAHFDSE